MTKIVVAPDSFKGTATAIEASELLSRGISEILPEAEILTSPMADGGEGTAACLASPTSDVITVPTVNALGRLSEASYFLERSTATAYIDIAAATGLPAVAGSGSAPAMLGDTFGTGVLIADAHSRGARTICLALGGSATVDGGSGIVVALGAQPIDARGYPVPRGGGYLGVVDSIDTASLNIGAAGLRFELLTDVTSPATGPTGAPEVFGPQKGAGEEDIRILDQALAHYCQQLNIDATTPGFGAAGATPVSLVWLSRLIYGDDSQITVSSGAAAVAEHLGLTKKIAGADLVVTGEGRLDGQSLSGKVMGTLQSMCHEAGVNLAVAAGSVEVGLKLGPATTAFGLAENSSIDEQLIGAGRDIAKHFFSPRG